MQELNRQEIAHVSGGYYDGGSIFDAIGNLSAAIGSAGESIGNAATFGLFAPIGKAAYGLGEVLTTGVVNIGNSLLGLFGIKAKQY